MIYSQPNQKSRSEEHTLTWKLLANGEAPEAALRKVPRVSRHSKHRYSNILFGSNENF